MSEKLWVEVETNKGTVHAVHGTKFTYSYRGSIEERDFQFLLNESESKRFIKLENVYWIDRDEWIGGELVISPVRFGRDYLYKNFLGPLYLRACDIVSIAPIDGDEDREWMDVAAKTRDEAGARWLNEGSRSKGRGQPL